MYSPSLDLEPRDGTHLPKCEVDFVWITTQSYSPKTVIILGECKDQGTIPANKLDDLRRIADALPSKRFKTFVLLAKLRPFLPEEIELTKALTDEYESRVILLTDRELEPYHLQEHTAEDLARATFERYFKAQPTCPAPGGS